MAVVYLDSRRGRSQHWDASADRLWVWCAEMELRHAMTQLGVQNVWFLDGKDTPSQDVLQSLANWGHGKNLEELVRIVRLTRPEVIISWLPGFFIGENHGDHQAAGVMAVEASTLPETRRCIRRKWRSRAKSTRPCSRDCSRGSPRRFTSTRTRATTRTSRKGPQYPTTGISSSHHVPYWRISMDVFRFHLTQYRTYIEKLQSLNDEQLEKLAGADQDSWSTPVELVFWQVAGARYDAERRCLRGSAGAAVALRSLAESEPAAA